VVTHLTTNPPVRCLNRAERTGSLVFNVLWSYVEEQLVLHLHIATIFSGRRVNSVEAILFFHMIYCFAQCFDVLYPCLWWLSYFVALHWTGDLCFVTLHDLGNHIHTHLLFRRRCLGLFPHFLCLLAESSACHDLFHCPYSFQLLKWRYVV
jgi:hypothetical protein